MKSHAICFVEMGSTNLSVSKAFYEACFGWGFQDMDETYTLFEAEGLGGGISNNVSPSADGTCLVIGVESIPLKMQEIVAAGGSAVGELVDIGNDMGFYQYFTDPVGNKLGVWSQVGT